MSGVGYTAPVSIKSELTRTLRGGQRFMSDMPFPRLLETRVLTAEIFKGRFSVDVPASLPAGCSLFFAADIPGLNTMTRGRADLPLLAPGVIRYLGEPLAVATAADADSLDDLCDGLHVHYEEEPPALSLEAGARREPDESLTHSEGRSEGAPKRALTVSGLYAAHFQEIRFPEPQCAVALWEKKVLTVYCSTRNPFHVRDNIALVLGIPVESLCLVVPDAAEDPGEKETLPAVIASLAALIAFLTGKAARVTLDNTIKQYPARISLSSGLTAGGLLAGTQAELAIDTGACSLHSPHLFRRAVYALPGPYRHNGLAVKARTVLTDRIPYTRLLSGGTVEACFAVEAHVARLARAAGVDPFTFRQMNLLRPPTAEGNAGAAERIMDEVARLSDFRRKHAAFEALRPEPGAAPDFSRPARGIGSALACYGFDFIEEAENHERHAVTLTLEKDGTLRLLTSALATGPALRRLFTVIAARTLEIDPEDVIIEGTDTSAVPDSGPMYETHALTSIGKLIEQACLALKTKKGETRKALSVTRTDALPAAHRTRRRPVYHPLDEAGLSWCATVIEAEVDPATCLVNVRGIWTTIECGSILNADIAVAQAEREIRRAWDCVEESSAVHQHQTRHRTLPDIHVSFVEIPYARGPLGAKGIGELPGLGIAPAYTAAVSQALGRDLSFFPVSPRQLAVLLEET
jgi:CO/xanthine dehydrogenase Mo-binding subunit